MANAAVNTCRRTARRGFTLVELMIVVVIIGVLVAASVPSFRRAIEQSRAELACANLRSIWSAQRIYWLEYQIFADSKEKLQNEGLLDSSLELSEGAYTYEVALTGTGFVATATPQQISTGQYTIDESGQVQGAINFPGWPTPISPIVFW
jgi:prepilin-type N-terminal cleavage/methylation domain-containing protein